MKNIISPLKRSVGNGLSVWAAWCEEPLTISQHHPFPLHALLLPSVVIFIVLIILLEKHVIHFTGL